MYVRQDTHTLSGTPDLTYFGEFMTSPIHYIYFTECVNLETTFMDSGLFAWISLRALSQDLFYS